MRRALRVRPRGARRRQRELGAREVVRGEPRREEAVEGVELALGRARRGGVVDAHRAQLVGVGRRRRAAADEARREVGVADAERVVAAQVVVAPAAA